MELFINPPSKTYKTRGNAIFNFNRACEKVGVQMKFIVSITADGQYFCVGLPREDQLHTAIALAGHGIQTARI